MAYRLHQGSVLPRLDVQRTAGWTLLRAPRPTATQLAELALYGVAFLMVFAVLFLLIVGALAALGRDGRSTQAHSRSRPGRSQPESGP